MKQIGLILSSLVFIWLSCDNPANLTTGENSGTQNPTLGSSSISGYVYYNDQAVFNAKVTLIGGGENLETVTDSQGAFALNDLKSGFYTIKASHSGLVFAPYTLQIAGVDKFGISIEGKEKTGLISDSRGLLWDYNFRTATSWDNAKSICSSLGGRLPTISEIYRNNSLSGTNDLVTETEDKVLWSAITWDKSTITTVKLKDGTIGNVPPSNLVSFRCVYPLGDESNFKSFVNSDLGGKVFDFATCGNNYIIDSYDRPPLPYYVALREADFVHGYIPSFGALSRAISKGLPNGSNRPLSCNDFVFSTGSYLKIVTLSWDQNLGFSGGISTAKYFGTDLAQKALPFRVMGPRLPTSNPKASQFYSSTMGLGTSNALENFKSLSVAHRECFALGKHLPYLGEVSLLQYQGLDGGVGTDFLWSADYAQGRAFTYKWAGVDRFLVPTFGGNVSLNYLKSNDLLKFISIAYDVNPNYAGPPSSNTRLQSFSKARPDGSVVKVWIDAADRPAKSLSEAIKEANELGAVLPTRRDLIELITSGLENGSNSFVYTSDVSSETSLIGIKWANTVDPSSFDESLTSVSGEIQLDSNIHPYRLMWTNERRLF